MKGGTDAREEKQSNIDVGEKRGGGLSLLLGKKKKRLLRTGISSKRGKGSSIEKGSKGVSWRNLKKLVEERGEDLADGGGETLLLQVQMTREEKERQGSGLCPLRKKIKERMERLLENFSSSIFGKRVDTVTGALCKGEGKSRRTGLHVLWARSGGCTWRESEIQAKKREVHFRKGRKKLWARCSQDGPIKVSKKVGNDRKNLVSSIRLGGERGRRKKGTRCPLSERARRHGRLAKEKDDPRARKGKGSGKRSDSKTGKIGEAQVWREKATHSVQVRRKGFGRNPGLGNKATRKRRQMGR